jgi:hypothetical protein
MVILAASSAILAPLMLSFLVPFIARGADSENRYIQDRDDAFDDPNRATRSWDFGSL